MKRENGGPMSETRVTKNDVKQFVDAAHGDFDKLKQLLADKPQLLNMPNGNETALGAACQMKRKDIIEYLLAQGAPLDIYTACVLGLTDKVAEFLDADPSLVNKKNKQSHVKPPVVFASEHPEVLALLKSRGAK
jgi:ankyrin repeat protein